MKKIEENQFTSEKINKSLSLLLVQMDKENKGQLGTKEIYSAFRLAITGVY
jgi:hypothetical protein